MDRCDRSATIKRIMTYFIFCTYYFILFNNYYAGCSIISSSFYDIKLRILTNKTKYFTRVFEVKT